MHILILNAAPIGPRSIAALDKLHLPHLTHLLRLLSPTDVVRSTANDLTPAHEHVIAASHGLHGADGLIPWAAADALAAGLVPAALPPDLGGWAWITPCHWSIQTDHVRMDDPLALALTPHDAESLLRDIQPYFTEDGISLFPSQAGLGHSHWLAYGAVFAKLPTASLDRVAGAVVDPWLPRQPQAQGLRRLQNEMQMLLYTHPVNDARARFHLPAVNAFWVSGTGVLATTPGATQRAASSHCQVRNALHAPALEDDALGWAQAWEALDGTTLANAVQHSATGQPLQLTLCSETAAHIYTTRPLNTWERLVRKLRPTHLADTLRAL
jgi:hypothetical protein